ncbi:M56 family metallopeptidase [Schlesneria paludicola]|uniref:M56 family metallopeptidase n=1 Tax=Schlesneria paludicola TaxID=360056 RepID=UPI0002E5791D|nr:M56 family metallopeptidase [Schlesneria paludicola]
MSIFDDRLSHQLVLKLGTVLIHFCWQGVLIAAIAGLTLGLTRRATPSGRYSILLGFFGLMMLSPVITFLCTAAPAPVSTMVRLDHPVPEHVILSTINRPLEISPKNSAPTPIISEVIDESHLPAKSSVWTTTEDWTRRNLRLLVVAWAVGVCTFSLRLILGWRAVVFIRRNGLSSTGTRLQSACQALAATLAVRQTVQVCESVFIQVPVVVGWLRPMILLPVRLMTKLSDEEIHAILGHELAHIRRHDYFVNIAQIVVENLLFYHPAVWWLSRRIRQEREYCCDDLAAAACGGKIVIARALATLAQLHAAAPYALPAATGGSLLARIRRLVRGDAPPDRLPSSGLGLGMLSMTVAILVLSLFLTTDPGQAQAQTKIETKSTDTDSAQDPTATQAANSFDELYRLRDDGRVIRRISIPRMKEAKQRYEAAAGPAQVAAMPDGPGTIIWKDDLRKVEIKSTTFGDPALELHSLIELLTHRSMSELEGPATLWLTKVPGDFVVWENAPEERLIADLEWILNRELNLNVSLQLEEVEREVYVAIGAFKANPAGPSMRFQMKPRSTYLLYGKAQAAHPSHFMGKYEEFWKAISLRTGRRIIDDSTQKPDDYMQWLISYDDPETTVWTTIPPKQFSANAEQVLQHVAEQTGLKFTEGRRKIQVLSLKRSDHIQSVGLRSGAAASKHPLDEANTRDGDIAAAIDRLRKQEIFVREFNSRNDPRYWIQVIVDLSRTIPISGDEILVDIETISRDRSLDLHLKNVDLTPASVARLGATKHISTLELSGRSINDELLQAISNLPIGRLELGSGPYTDDGVKQLANCVALESISIAGPSITNDCFTHLVRLPRLRGVGLRSSQFTSGVLATLARIPDLRRMTISTTEQLTFDLGPFSELRSVDFTGATFGDDLTHALAEKCPRLEEASIRNSSITNAGVAALVPLRHLRVLALDRAQIDDRIADSIQKMPNLEWLDLNNCDIGDRTLAAASGCSRLSYLNLGQTQISNEGLAVIGKLKNIRNLSLWSNQQLTDECVSHLKQLPDYRMKFVLHLQLDGTQITKNGILELQAALPNASISPAAASQ